MPDRPASAPGAAPAYTVVVRESGGEVVAEATLGARPLRLGRSPDCELRLNSPRVSRNHALVYLDADGVAHVVDEGSRTGTTIDGQRAIAPTPLTPGNEVQIAEFTITLRRAGGPRRLRLKARGGPYDGRPFPVDKPELRVGRDPACEIRVDDPSISRHHAVVQPADDGLEVADLRSRNGTFVNGERTRRAIARLGDRVRFGDLVFVVEADSKESSTALLPTEGRAPRRHVAWAVGGVTALAVLAAGLAAWRPGPESGGGDEAGAAAAGGGTGLSAIQAEVQEKIDEGKAELEARRWQRAEAAFAAALGLDPINEDALRLRGLARRELEHEELFARGSRTMDLGGLDNQRAARELLAKIPADSGFVGQARVKLREIDGALADAARVEGVSQCRARWWDRCARALCEFFERMGDREEVPGESELRKLLAQAEGRLPAAAPRCAAPRYTGELRPLSGAATTAEGALRERFAHEEVRAAIALYVAGKLDDALKQVQKLAGDRRLAEEHERLREIERLLQLVRGKYQEGYAAWRERRAEAAQVEWDQVIEADRALLGDGIAGFYRAETARLIGDLYLELADEEMSRLRYREAFARLSAGRRSAPAHDGLRNALLKLEETAKAALREAEAYAARGDAGPARERAELARDITEPGGATRGAAEELLGRLGGG